uniref:ATP synthase complex subunit 8 n=1 Tax=Tribolium audax TaxID=188755 RepID=A0A068LEH1_TRIAU|nr:ATP synthase F0 subunit 8 [Tribolium audax]AIE43740.1 ATP synthase F0 subunit 8 [Tribolium audax]
MPQMAPLNWLLLMIMFIMIMVSFNLINFYSFSYNTQKSPNSIHQKSQTNWKW